MWSTSTDEHNQIESDCTRDNQLFKKYLYQQSSSLFVEWGLECHSVSKIIPVQEILKGKTQGLEV